MKKSIGTRAYATVQVTVKNANLCEMRTRCEMREISPRKLRTVEDYLLTHVQVNTSLYSVHL